LSHIDYELVILDMIPAAGLTWRGNANELIASYAVCPLLLKYLYLLLIRKPSQADGYARVNGIGAFVTTFGPGELSAYCGMAGQYTEYVRLLQAILVIKANHV
jgi:pyruvate decarboxylase